MRAEVVSAAEGIGSKLEDEAGELSSNPERAAIELGWVLVGHFSELDRLAVAGARKNLLEMLRDHFPQYAWEMPQVNREAPAAVLREEPVDLFDLGVQELQAKHWDFSFVVTERDLRSYERPFALGAPSRSLSVAALSTQRLDPRASGRGNAAGERQEILTRRLTALCAHLFGHLTNLSHQREAETYMFNLGAVADLDAMKLYSEESLEELESHLAEVADERLEERSPASRPRRFFYLRTALFESSSVFSAVRRSRPWRFPFRLSRLTAAAFSAVLLLSVTAEAWDLGTSQDPLWLAGFSAATLALTSFYLLRRQRLLTSRSAGPVTELSAVTNLSMAIVVTLGLFTTYALLFTSVVGLSLILFPPQVLGSWALAIAVPLNLGHYFSFAAFASSLGILIGALGASFEEQRYFRHVALVDEET